MRAALDLCCFDLPTQTPTLIFSSHLGMTLFPYSEACETCSGNLKAWLSFTSNECATVIFSIGDTPLPSNLDLFLMFTANETAYGQNALVTNLGQRCVERINILRSGSQIFFMRFSALPF